MKLTKVKPDYSERDLKGLVSFYVLLFKRQDVSPETFSDYWRNVHGPVCARLPSQYQYWQFHLGHNPGTLWSQIEGIDYNTMAEDQFEGIAELTFTSEQERQTWFDAASILMDDEHNLFRKAIGYNTSANNSQTYIDSISECEPNGTLRLLKFHVMVKKAPSVSVEEFRSYLKNRFAPAVIKSDAVLKFRLHLFEEIDNSRADATGVVHTEPIEKQYQAAFEIAFVDSLGKEQFFASEEYQRTMAEQVEYISQIGVFPEQAVHTFVYDGQMTLAGQRSSTVAQLISEVGAINQLQNDVVSLMNGNTSFSNEMPNLEFTPGCYLQGIHHLGVTVKDMEKSLEFYTEILGGKLVVAENNLIGDVIQNTLFQQEELDAISQKTKLKALGVPNLRDGSEALDLKFISFGNACIELIHFRDADSKQKTFNSAEDSPSHVGRINTIHLSFLVEDDVDLNLFAQNLEQECQKRGFTNIVFNRIVRVKSEAERKAVAFKYNSNKYWNEPDSEEESLNDYGEFEGWALFYCKGPNGEQLEFNQAIGKIKTNFAEAQQKYQEERKMPVANSNTKNSHSTKKEKMTAEGGQRQAHGMRDGSRVPSASLTGEPLTLERLPGTSSSLVKQLFSRGEAFDSEGFITFFTDDPVYQFGNFEPCLDKAAIKKSADNFFGNISGVYHDIKMMWEVGDVVFVEMDVTYWRKDGSIITLPCFDIFRLEGNKFAELRIFMDVNPVFDSTIAVPNSASVMTLNQGEKLAPPELMKKFYSEDINGQKRVAVGFAPKWLMVEPEMAKSNSKKS